MFRHIVVGFYVAVFLTPAYAYAADVSAPVEAAAPAKMTSLTPAVVEELRKIITSRVTTISLIAQNKRYAGIDQAEIDELDKQWRAETKSASQPLIAQLMGNPLSSFLIRKKAESLGLFTEIFVFDAKGLNVGQSSVTSDYWQGDEPKYQETFAKGRDAILIDEPEYDAETKSTRQQVSFAIIDPDSNELIGAATIEINVDELARRGALPQS
ncbi:MAG: hypothetical protein ACOH12_07060 [Parvibaculaceae bacterium]